MCERGEEFFTAEYSEYTEEESEEEGFDHGWHGFTGMRGEGNFLQEPTQERSRCRKNGPTQRQLSLVSKCSCNGAAQWRAAKTQHMQTERTPGVHSKPLVRARLHPGSCITHLAAIPFSASRQIGEGFLQSLCSAAIWLPGR